MKRCPQCEFIYEDDQSHCDMDGTRLTHDANALPKLQALTTTSTSSDKSKARSRIVAVLATLVLAGVMALVYYVSMRQPQRTTTIAISPSVEAAAQPDPAVSPATTTEGSTQPPLDSDTTKKAEPPKDPSRNSEITKPEVKPSPKSDTNKATSQTRSNNQAASPAKPEEKDDKVKSALKKTGRFFKKAIPF
jgi:hypothetical protein